MWMLKHSFKTVKSEIVMSFDDVGDVGESWVSWVIL